MATAKVIDKISDHLTCALCLDKYKEPKSLPCQHTFCRACITTHIEKQTAGSWCSLNWFHCPVCRANTTLPRDGVSAFPTNFTLQNIAQDIEDEASHKASVTTPDLSDQINCASCDSSGISDVCPVGICTDCSEKLCQECIDAHSRVKITRSHTIKYLPNDGRDSFALKKDGYSGKGQKQWLCEKHSGAVVTHFCVECDLPLCTDCMVDIIGKEENTHLNHTIGSLDKVLAGVQSEFKSEFKMVEELGSTLTEDVQRMTQLQEQLSAQHAHVLAEVQGLKSQFVEWAERVTKKASDLTAEQDGLLSMSKYNLELGLAILQTGQQDIEEKAKEEGFRLLKNKAKVQTQIKELLDSVRQEISSVSMATNMSISLKSDSDQAIYERLKAALDNVIGETEPHVNTVGSGPQDSGLQVSPAESLSDAFETLFAEYPSAWDIAVPAVDDRSGANSLQGKNVENEPFLKILQSLSIDTSGMVGMRFTNSYDFFAVENGDYNIITHCEVSRDYEFTLANEFGGNHLKDAFDVDQLPDGRVIVADGRKGHSVKVFDQFGDGWRRTANIAHNKLKDAASVATSPAGDIIALDLENVGRDPTVYRFELLGGDRFSIDMTIQTFNGGRRQFETPWYIACSAWGDIAVSDHDLGTVKCFDENGQYLWQYGRCGSGRLQMRGPKGICFDSQSRLYVCDTGNERIHVLDDEGKLIRHIPFCDLGPLFYPHLLSITPNDDLVLGTTCGSIKIVQLNFS